jgi:hypothetical protein
MTVRWGFVRLVVVLAVLAVVAFDGISILTTHFSASDDANRAALAAATIYNDSNRQNTAGALIAATQSLPSGETVVPGSLHFNRDGSVDLEVRKTARSLALHWLKQTKSWAVVTESGQANPPS